MTISHVLETCLYVDDLADSERFYRDLLGLELYAREDGRHLFFRCGSGMLLLFRAEQTSTVQTRINGALIPLHGANGPGHVAFAVELDALSEWKEKFTCEKIPIESEVHWPNGGVSVYIRDPSGNSVELATASIWTAPATAP